MSKTQLERAYRKAWERMTRGDGYQMFGYDVRTLEITRPSWVATLRRLSNLHGSAAS